MYKRIRSQIIWMMGSSGGVVFNGVPQKNICRKGRAQKSKALMSPRNNHNPKPEIEVAEAWHIIDAAGGATAVSKAIPRTAAQHATPTTRRSEWINSRPCLVRPVPVLTPLPHVSMHVVQPELVCEPKNACCDCPFANLPFRHIAIRKIPVVVSDRRRDRLAKRERRRCSSAACVFPFCFGRQAIQLAGLTGQARTKLDCVFPAHILDRTRIALEPRRIRIQLST